MKVSLCTTKFVGVFVGVAFFMGLFESLKQFLLGNSLTLWASHFITIMATAVVATVASIFMNRWTLKVDEQLRVAATAFEAQEGMVVTDANSLVVHVNHAFSKITGYAPEEIIGKNLRVLQSDRHDASFFAHMWDSICHTGAWQGEIWNRHKDGKTHPEYINITAVKNNEGSITNYVATLNDITERKLAEQELRIAATAFETDEGIIVTDCDARILKVNNAFTYLTGYSAEDVVGKTPAILHSGRQDATFYSVMRKTLARDKYWQGEVWNRRKNGEVYPEWLTITAVIDARGEVSNYVAVFSDITQRKIAEEKISFLAYYDQLTALPNRELFYDRLSQAVPQARRKHNHLALLYLDLDGFKGINDNYGHDAGDEVLKMAANRISDCVRNVDTVARLGGDEFAVVLGEIKNTEDVTGVVEKIIAKLAKPMLLQGTHACSVGVSIGIALYPEDGTEIDRLISAADSAMYESKVAGKGTYTFSTKHTAGDIENLPWVAIDGAYLLGIPEIDHQHLELAGLLNKLNEAVNHDEPAEAVNQLFDVLIEKVRFHFETEDRLMDENGYRDEKHKREHQHLLAEVGHLREKFFHSGKLRVLKALKEWLLGHVLRSDKIFADFLIKQRFK